MPPTAVMGVNIQRIGRTVIYSRARETPHNTPIYRPAGNANQTMYTVFRKLISI